MYYIVVCFSFYVAVVGGEKFSFSHLSDYIDIKFSLGMFILMYVCIYTF